MSASDWWLVVLICVCVGAVGIGLGYLWGLARGLSIADRTIEELHKLYAMSSEENTALRNDLTRQLNEQFER
jgi:hypothetical protein